MNAHRFWPLIVLGLALSIGAAVAQPLLSLWLGGSGSLRVLAIACGLAWLLASCMAIPKLVARGLLALLITTGLATLIVFDPALPWWWLLPVAAGWGVRSLARDNAASSALDALISVIAVLLAAAAWGKTGSLALAIWTYSLLQSFAVLLPSAATPAAAAASPFDTAQRTAEAALQRLYQTPR